jgi:hypothetical protein
MKKYQLLLLYLQITQIDTSVNVPEYKSFKCNFQIKSNNNAFRVRKQSF